MNRAITVGPDRYTPEPPFNASFIDIVGNDFVGLYSEEPAILLGPGSFECTVDGNEGLGEYVLDEGTDNAVPCEIDLACTDEAH